MDRLVRGFAETYRFHLGGWVLWAGLVALAGLAFGLAGWMPWRRIRCRWTRALLLGVVPLVMLAYFPLLQSGWWAQDFLHRYYWRLHLEHIGTQFALAVLLGVAVPSGFAPRRERT